jgi:hypothetical protein
MAAASSTFASPKMTYVSDTALLNTSGFAMTNVICAPTPSTTVP